MAYEMACILRSGWYKASRRKMRAWWAQRRVSANAEKHVARWHVAC